MPNTVPTDRCRSIPLCTRALLARGSALCSLALMVLVVGCSAGVAGAPSEIEAPEYSVKAAVLSKFGDYFEWPAGAFVAPNSPLTIGVIAADGLADELARMVAGRTVAGRSVVVSKPRRDESLTGLHIVFIGSVSNDRLREVLDAIRGQATLTVTESDDALKLGSMINLVVVDKKVRFDICLGPVESASLKVSARLLAVARKVIGRSA
jgi:hypothetical protein